MGASSWAERGLQAEGAGDPRLPGRGPEGLLPIHAGAKGGEFMLEEGLIDPVPPIARYFDRQGIG